MASLGLTAFNMFTPNLREMARMDADSPEGSEARVGEVVASAVTTAAGAIASAISGRQWPLWVSVLVSVVFMMIHEFVLQGPRLGFGGSV